MPRPMKKFVFTDLQKKAIVKYFKGQLSQTGLAEQFNVQRQQVPNITNAIFCHLEKTGKIDITQLINNY